jgi:hypothetical protein
MTERAFGHAWRLKRPEAPLFILGAATRHGQQAQRTLTPARLQRHVPCLLRPARGRGVRGHRRALEPGEFADSDHYTRTGYFKIAQFVNARAARPGEAAPAEPAQVLGAA